jgi:hypothetical protein
MQFPKAPFFGLFAGSKIAFWPKKKAFSYLKKQLLFWGLLGIFQQQGQEAKRWICQNLPNSWLKRFRKLAGLKALAPHLAQR